MDVMDIVIASFIVGAAYRGWRSGLVLQLLGLLSLFVAFVAGAYLRVPIGAIVSSIVTTLPDDAAQVVGYVIAFVVVFIAVNIVLTKLYGQVRLTGISDMADDVAGAVVGGLVAILIVSAAIAILDTFYGQPGNLGETAAALPILRAVHDALEASWIADVMRETTVPLMLTILGPIIPDDLSLDFLD